MVDAVALEVSEFVGRYERLQLGNGGSWRCGDGPLAREFSIHRIKEQGRIAAVELHGEQQQPIGKPIPARIKAQIAAPRCVALYTSNPERGQQGRAARCPPPERCVEPGQRRFPAAPKSGAQRQPPAQPHPPKNQPNAPPPASQPPTAQRQHPSHRGSHPGRHRHDVRGLRVDAGGSSERYRVGIVEDDLRNAATFGCLGSAVRDSGSHGAVLVAVDVAVQANPDRRE